jgi:uncharacterized membrane protein YdbT with pleckstrin-like domain
MPKTYIDNLLGDNEKILLNTRQHWFMLARNILIELAFVLLLTIGITVLIGSFGAIWAGFLYFLLLIPGFFILVKFLTWNSQRFIITNHRVININGVINKNVIDSSLEKVNDVKLTQSYLGRFFNYGDIEIMTASEFGVNYLKRINRPIKYKTTMLNAKEATDHLVVMDNLQSTSINDKDIPGLIIKLGELKSQGLITEIEFTQKKTDLLRKLGSS